ncbi:hypothetical protein PV416_01550 [Streptomyces ipomoeae]|nr:hypothetical protein [Streptomyces ipomoeae]MDX2819790.1 hypothetical protein [Streptomyces ipomoeae]MDX2872416.1 hypothetical protein [Streptomyces ipomoeae]
MNRTDDRLLPVLLICAQAVVWPGAALVIRAEDVSSGTRVSAGVFFALLWLRRAPRTAYGALLGLALLWPVAMAVGDYNGPILLPPALSLLATCAALGSDELRGTTPGPPAEEQVGRRDRRGRREARLTDIAALPAESSAVLVHAAAATAAVLDRGTTVPTWAVPALAALAASLAVAAARWAGALRDRRERADRGARDERLATWTEEAVRDAWAERRRIAAGLETTVLARTADMVTEAEAGRLDAAADRAREALAAMRALLDTVREGETAPELRPQPTLQALDLLAHQLRATGRDVEIRLTDRVPERLPTAVDLAAYHAAETVLATGGEEPAALELDVDDDTLTLTATGVPRAADPAVRERLTTRVSALGGTLTTGPQGTVRLRLPLAVAQGNSDSEERQR